MRDCVLWNKKFGDQPISQVEKSRLEAIINGEVSPENEGHNGITLEDLLERIRIELVVRSLPEEHS